MLPGVGAELAAAVLTDRKLGHGWKQVFGPGSLEGGRGRQKIRVPGSATVVGFGWASSGPPCRGSLGGP